MKLKHKPVGLELLGRAALERYLQHLECRLEVLRKRLELEAASTTASLHSIARISGALQEVQQQMLDIQRVIERDNVTRATQRQTKDRKKRGGE